MSHLSRFFLIVMRFLQSTCFKWPCQNNGKCMALYEKNSYVCVCAKGYTGEHCETGEIQFSVHLQDCFKLN